MNFEVLINLVVGILFSLVLGFFVLQLIITAITMATEYSGNADTLKKAQQTLTAGIKGIALALVTVILLNTILSILGVTSVSGNPVTYITGRIQALESCLRDYNTCGR
jgi:hypothetical protein